MTDEVTRAVETLRRGGVIVYPTDTVWGIGCDACNPDAVARVYRIKQRTDSKALITLTGSIEQLERYVDNIPDVAFQLLEAAVAPLTIVFDSAPALARNLAAPDGSVGVRLTSDPFCAAMCRRLGRPVVSTSANISGQPAPAVFTDISPEIIEAADLTVDWRRDDTSRHAPSTVIRLGNDATVKILRP